MSLADTYLHLAITATSLLSSIYVLFEVDHEGYENLFLLPLSFGIAYFLLLRSVLLQRRSVFIVVFTIIASSRYVVLPVLITATSSYGGRSQLEPIAQSYRDGILLMFYELAVTSVFIYFVFGRNHSANRPTEAGFTAPFRQGDGNPAYWIFGLVFIVSWVLFPSIPRSLSFVTPSTGSRDAFESLSLYESFGIYGTLVFKQVIFVVVASHMHAQYRRSGRQIFVFFAALAGALNVALYFGTNRSDILICATVTWLVLYRLFGRQTFRHLLLFGVLTLAVLAQATLARDLYSDPNRTLPEAFADTLQVYLGGPYNVAIAVEVRQSFPEAATLEVLFMDIFRPMIGPNIFLKSVDIPYSNMFFNQRIFSGTNVDSQIMPMIGQGNLHFGFLLAPLLTILFVALASALTQAASMACDPKLYYFLTLALVRLGFMMGQNTMNMINDLSMNLFLFLILYQTNRFLGRAGRRGA